MSKKLRSNILLSISLVLTSILFYRLQILLFHDSRDTFFYILQDIAFIPLQVLITSLILERIWSVHEKQDIKRKVNVVISAFYSEVGTGAMSMLWKFTQNLYELKELMAGVDHWSEADFRKAASKVAAMEFDADSRQWKLDELKQFLVSKKNFMLSLFENTNLLEHDTFTDMLWAVFHLMEELESREMLKGLPDNDMEHLSLDIKRAYKLLVIQWIYYMKHLKKAYPYLFSLAARKSPFRDNSTVIIQ